MDLILSIIFAITPIDGSCYRVMDSSNIQEFFHLSQNVLPCNEEKTLELKKDIKKRMNINNILKISKFCVMRHEKIRKINKLNVVVWSFCSKKFTASKLPYVILCPNLMTV